MNPILFLRIACLAALLPALGCVSLTKRYPEKRTYAFDVAHAGPTRAAKPGIVLKVREFRVSPAYDSKSFHYKKSDGIRETDYYREFFILPGSMITDVTRRWMDDAAIVAHVVDRASELEATHILEGHIDALYGDFTDSAAPAAVMEIQLYLLSERSGGPEILFHRRYAKRPRVESPKADALFQGWNTALREILLDAEKDFAALDWQSPR